MTTRLGHVQAGTTYRFPHDPTASNGALSRDFAADRGSIRTRIDVWHQVLADVQSREPLPDTTDGVALRFPIDVDVAGRLAAAEYRCCSFGSHTSILGGAGLPLEIRMSADAAGTFDAVAGLGDTTVESKARGAGTGRDEVRVLLHAGQVTLVEALPETDDEAEHLPSAVNLPGDLTAAS